MIEVEIEDDAWAKALPDVEEIALKAARAALRTARDQSARALPLNGGGLGGGVSTGLGETGARGAAGAALSDLPDPSAAAPPTPALPPLRGKGAQLLGSREDDSIVILLTDDATVRDLNARFRGKDSTTNVLSFPAHDTAHGHLGDICLAYGVCAREADEQGKTLAAHLQHLVAHGVLHLVGYDHEDEAEAEVMEDLERRILAGLGLPDPYDERRGS